MAETPRKRGRKPYLKDEEKRVIGLRVMVRQASAERFDRLAKAAGLTRSQALRLAIGRWMDEAETTKDH